MLSAEYIHPFLTYLCFLPLRLLSVFALSFFISPDTEKQLVRSLQKFTCTLVSPLCVYKISQNFSFFNMEYYIKSRIWFWAKYRFLQEEDARGLTVSGNCARIKLLGGPPGRPFFVHIDSAQLLDKWVFAETFRRAGSWPRRPATSFRSVGWTENGSFIP